MTKLLTHIKNNSKLFQEPELNYILGLTTTQIKDLKKEAMKNSFIHEIKREFFLSEEGEKFLAENPQISWVNEENAKRPEINLEYLKLEKAPPTVTRAIRLLAKHLLESEELKENSIEYYLVRELLCAKSTCAKVKKEMSKIILKDKRLKLVDVFEKFTTAPYGLTKSIISVLLLDILSKNLETIAIYENGQFQLRLTPLMFDRMIYCPQNFEIQNTIIEDIDIIEDLSKVILPCKSKNILDLTKGLIGRIRGLNKFALGTEKLNRSTVRLRNVILNAKDPISLFYRDIPMVLENKILCECDKKFIVKFENALSELENCYENLVNELKDFLFTAFEETSRENLAKRFEACKDYLGDSELKILFNNINELGSSEILWIERIATFVNKSRVPKDWSDNDVADFKVKVKEFALRFLTVESTVSTIDESCLNKDFQTLLTKLNNLSKREKNIILRKVAVEWNSKVS